MRQSVCEELNIFIRRVFNLTQYEKKGLWAAKNVLLMSVKLYTVWAKGLWAAKHLLFKSDIFNTVLDNGFVNS